MALTDNLAHYWKLNETGTTATRVDEVGSVDLTVPSGAVQNSVTGKNSNAMETDTGWLSRTDAAGTGSLNSESFSIAFWMKHATISTISPSAHGPIAYGGDNAADGWGIWSDGSSSVGLLQARIRDSSTSTVTINTGLGAIQDDTWHFITLTRVNGGSFKFYVDSILLAENVSSGTSDWSSATSEFRVGANRAQAEDFRVDEVGYWTRALTQTEISTLYNGGAGNYYDNTNTNDFDFSGFNTSGNLSSKLVSYWKLEEVSGNRADVKGTNHLEEGQGTVSSRTGLDGTGADLVGADTDRLWITNADQTGLDADDFTLSFWLNPDSLGSNQFAVSQTQGGANGWSTYVDTSGNLHIDGYPSKWNANSGGGEINVGEWNHIAMTWENGVAARGYVNGVEVVEDTTVGTSDFANDIGSIDHFSIAGRSNASEQYVDGAYDEVAYFNSVLTADDINLLYNNGVGNFFANNNPGGEIGFDRENIDDLTTDLQNFWALLETGGSDTRADTQGSMDLTPVGSPLGDASGIILDATGKYVGAASSGLDLTNDEFTFSIWAQHENPQANANGMLLGTVLTTNPYFYLTGTSGATQVRAQGNDSTGAQFGSFVLTHGTAAGTEFHLVLTVKRNEFARLYGNGGTYDGGSGTFSQDTTVEDRTFDGSTADFRIGQNRASGGDQWRGQIRYVAFWNRALIEAEVKSLYNSGTPLTLSEMQGLLEATADIASDTGTALAPTGEATGTVSETVPIASDTGTALAPTGAASGSATATVAIASDTATALSPTAQLFGTIPATAEIAEATGTALAVSGASALNTIVWTVPPRFGGWNA